MVPEVEETARGDDDAELFDAFDDSFAAGENARKRAERFLELRDELLGRATTKKEIAHSAAGFLERLRELPEERKNLLKEFGRRAKGMIEAVPLPKG